MKNLKTSMFKVLVCDETKGVATENLETRECSNI